MGALIIKELFDLSDDEIVENLMLDVHYQYALRTTSYEEQPLSDKSLSRFRKRCYDYEQKHGIDLFHDCICDLNGKIAKLMGINSRIRRMDSMMIEANIRSLSRIELLYSCVARLVQYIHKNGNDVDLSGLEHYYQPNDGNFVVYHCRNAGIDERINAILKDADSLLCQCTERYQDVEEYRLLLRCLGEQTIVENESRRLRTKSTESLSPSSLQNPVDPDATYCSKAGKGHVGYAANVVEAVSTGGSVITDYQYEQNIYSDSQFLRDHLERQDIQVETVQIVADGAYSGQKHRDLATEKNIEIINTALKGMRVPDIYAEFMLSNDGERVLRCPAGHAPESCTFVSATSKIRARFSHEYCINCPHQEQCCVKLRKSTHLVVISRSSVERAKQQRTIQAVDFQNWHRIRNGVESIPSILRNWYHVDKIQVRGLIPSKFFFGAKISAMNFNKLLRQRRGLFCCTSNPLVA